MKKAKYMLGAIAALATLGIATTAVAAALAIRAYMTGSA